MAQAFRCPDAGFQEPKCEQIRQEGLRVGCIDQAKYQKLKGEGRFPGCMGSTFIGDCPCGCFAPETLIELLTEVGSENMPAYSLYKNWKNVELASLEDEAHLTKPTYVARSIAVATEGDESKALVRIELDNGSVLRLTEKHPVLKASGQMITAREVTLGDKLVDRNGDELFIRKVGREPYDGKVYNFETDGKTLASHVVVAEGVLVGDLAWQNALEQELGGIAIRK